MMNWVDLSVGAHWLRNSTTAFKKDGSLPNPNQRYTLDDGDVTIHHSTWYIGTPVGCKKNQVANLFTYMYKYERSRGDIWWSCNLKAMGPFQAYRHHAVGAFRHLQAQLWLNLNCWIVLLAAKWRMISLNLKKRLHEVFISVLNLPHTIMSI